jgi:hypothetical protein
MTENLKRGLGFAAVIMAATYLVLLPASAAALPAGNRLRLIYISPFAAPTQVTINIEFVTPAAQMEDVV